METENEVKKIQKAHIRTIHGGVSLNMGEVRKSFWIQMHEFFLPKRNAGVAANERIKEVTEY